jgi:FemAB-related protein (PEP-CTERM system-associated)
VIEVDVSERRLPADWDAFVRCCKTCTPYHLSGWRDVLSKTYRHRGYYLSARNDAGIAGILPLFHVKSLLFGHSLTSLPFLTYGGLCAAEPAAAAALLREADALRDRLRARFVELRHTGSQKVDLPSSDHKVAMVLALRDSEQTTFKKLRREIRNRIRKAEKAGVDVVSGGTELVSEFYEAFAENMRDLGSPVHSRRFFENMFALVPEQVRLYCARVDGRTAGGGITVTFRDGMEVPWVSTSQRFRRIAANNLIYWRAIQEACRLGLKRFDFGRSTPGSGTYEFKRRWGAEPVQLHWQYSARDGGVHASGAGGEFGLAERIWSRLPVPLTKLVGPPIRGQITL